MMKAVAFGFLIPVISVHMGLQTEHGAAGVGKQTTNAVMFIDGLHPGGGCPFPPPLPPVIEYRQLWKAFDAPVLAGVDLTVQTGEMFGILRALGDREECTPEDHHRSGGAGSGGCRGGWYLVYFGGGEALARIRRSVGYVFQNAALFDSLNVSENVEMGIPEAELPHTGASGDPAADL